MMHNTRRWYIVTMESAEELAQKLTNYTWTGCTGFALQGYLFLNDATSADGAQEFAIVKLPATPGAPFLQVESITCSCRSMQEALTFVECTLRGEYDHQGWPVSPQIESLKQHDRCHLCV